VDARAAQFMLRPLPAAAQPAALRFAIASLDLTSLEGRDGEARIRALCARARRPDPDDPSVPPVAAVCVSPRLVVTAREALAGSPVRVAAVAAGFPSALSPLAVRLAEVEAVVHAGAHEVDAVLARGPILAGRRAEAERELRELRRACGPARLKLILEAGELETYDRLREAADLALACGADFVKTSTGKIEPAATPGNVLVLLQAAREHARCSGRTAGVKASGGIRTARQALGYLQLARAAMGDAWLAAGLFRFGASTLLADLLLHLRRLDGREAGARWSLTEAGA
jgi:deoxyribose-phosphate aldolase